MPRTELTFIAFTAFIVRIKAFLKVVWAKKLISESSGTLRFERFTVSIYGSAQHAAGPRKMFASQRNRKQHGYILFVQACKRVVWTLESDKCCSSAF